MSVMIYPHNANSNSARQLAQALGVKRISKGPHSKFVGALDKIVINWGSSSSTKELDKCVVINRPEFVAYTTNKLSCFKVLRNNNIFIPPFTEDQQVAIGWVNEGKTVVARHILNGSGGEGIELLNGLNDFPCIAPLYTMYIKKKQEYRIHIINGQVIKVQRKARDTTVPDNEVNWKIRNHGNGFVFIQDDGPVPNDVILKAIQAVSALGLTFGAVDVIYNEGRQMAYVLEVNTAPGLEGQTIDAYANGFRDYLEQVYQVGF